MKNTAQGKELAFEAVLAQRGGGKKILFTKEKCCGEKSGFGWSRKKKVADGCKRG